MQDPREPRPTDAPVQDADAIAVTVRRLGRPHPKGGTVIERAAILAEGKDSGSIIEWIELRSAEPEYAVAGRTASRGLHADRHGVAGAGTPLRYVLPAGALG